MYFNPNCASENGLVLIHARIGEKECWIIQRDRTTRVHIRVFLIRKEIEKITADLIGSQILVHCR